jgi:hypothetical protein
MAQELGEMKFQVGLVWWGHGFIVITERMQLLL